MKDSKQGWVIVNIGHPSSGRKFVCGETFSRTSLRSIKKFIDGGSDTWNKKRNKLNYRCVRATLDINTNNTNI